MLLAAVCSVAVYAFSGGRAPPASSGGPTVPQGYTRARPARLEVTALDGATFDEALGFDGLAVVKFYAPWCRLCKRVGPGYKKAAGSESDDVRFFEVDFSTSKDLCKRERVFMLPTVHFYTSGAGRINRFTLSGSFPDKTIARELDRYVGDSGHLKFLRSLLDERPHSELPALSRLRTYKNLVGVLQAFQDVPAIAAAAAKQKAAAQAAAGKGKPTGAALASVLGEDPQLEAELEGLFEWIDSNRDGVIDASELAAVAAAVCSAPSADDAYAGMLDRAVLALAEGAEGAEAEEAGEESGEEAEGATVGEHGAEATLDKASFFRLMIGKQVVDFASPEKELLPSFQSLDVNDDGEISRDEFLAGMEKVCATLDALPPGTSQQDCREWADTTAVAFETLDRDKSGTLDYEEFVAMLSGVRLSTAQKCK